MPHHGYVLGPSIVVATARCAVSGAFAPDYAGIPVPIVVAAVEDFALRINLPFEQLE